jgi:predicted ABC-type ATPase
MPGPRDQTFLDRLIAGFENLVARILARVSRKTGQLLGADPGHATDRDLKVVQVLWVNDLDEHLLPALEKVWNTSAARTAKQLAAARRAAADEVAALTAPDAAAYLRAARNRLVAVADHLWHDTREQLAQGVEAGDDVAALTARVKAAAGVTEPRARVIARTEVIAAHNGAGLAQARMIDDPAMTKTWLATPDTRTRETHQEADGQTVPIGDLFYVGDAALDFPGDPTGPPEEVVSCRCSIAVDFPDTPTVTAGGSPYDEAHHILRDDDGKFAHEGGLTAVTDEGELLDDTERALTSVGDVFNDADYLGQHHTEGSYGDLALAVYKNTDDIRMGFHDFEGQVHELDLTPSAATEMSDAVAELMHVRDDLEEPDKAVDPEVPLKRIVFGDQSEHAAELYPGGVISLSFFDDEDPYVLDLDPGVGGVGDDVPGFFEAVDSTVAEAEGNKPVTASGYDEAHHVVRDDEGKFAHTAGMPAVTDAGTLLQVGPGGGGIPAWAHSVLKTSGGPVTVGAAAGGRVTLMFGDGDHQAHTWLSEDNADRFAQRLFRAKDHPDDGGVRPGRQFSVADYPPGDEHALPVGFAAVHRDGDDAFRLQLMHGADEVSLSGDDTQTLAKEIYRFSSSRRVDTASGVFTVIPNPGGKTITTEWPATAGKPFSLELTPHNAEDFAEALRETVGNTDEFPVLADDVTPALGPHDPISSKDVKVGNTVLTITAFGQYDNGGYVTVESSAHDWSLKLPVLEANDVQEAVQRVSDPENSLTASGKYRTRYGRLEQNMSSPLVDINALTAASTYDEAHHIARGKHGKFARKGEAVTAGPLDEAEFAARQSLVEDVIGKARHTLSTDVTYSKDGAWDPERDKLHRKIAADLYKQASGVPNEGKSVIAGGLGGAGKSTVLRDHAGVDAKNFLTVNPDDIKEEMAARDLIPEVPDHPELSPMERAALVHEESSRIALLLADMAYQDRKNMIWDVTMSSEKSAKSRIDALKRHGYNDVKGVFVDIPVETSVDRALSRYRRGIDQWRAGKGPGGRFVPPSIIRAQKTSSGQTVNRDVFSSLQKEFSDWALYDNSVTGRAPKLVDQGGPTLTAAAGRRQAQMGQERPVSEVLDDLDAGTISIGDAAADFAGRVWPRPQPVTDAEAWGVDDDPAPLPDSWDIVNADSRLTAAQYRTLAAAYQDARREPAAKDTGLVAVDRHGRPIVAASTALHMGEAHDQTSHGNRYPAGPTFADPVPADPAALPPAAPAAPAVAAPVHTGAMIALVPSDADAARLAVDGGEPVGELHCTLMYLGEAADIPADVRQHLIDAVGAALTGWPVVEADAFALSLFNPGDSNDFSPCIVLGLSGEDLDHVHGLVDMVVLEVVDGDPDVDDGEPDDGVAAVIAAAPAAPAPAAVPAVPAAPADPVPAGAGWCPPEQHLPWLAHTTLIYSDDPSQLAGLVDRLGPVVFDRVRIVFAGDATDIPLSPEPQIPGDGETPPAGGVPAVASGREFLSRMPAVLQRYWLKKLAPWGEGSFARCVPQIAHYFPKDPKGTCANLHHEATGEWPGAGHHASGSEITMSSPTMPAAPGQAPAPATVCPDGQTVDPTTGECVPAAAGMAAAVAVPVTPVAPAAPAVVADPCPDGQHPDPVSGDCVDDTTEPPAAAAAKPEHFHAIMHEEGVSTGLRTFVPGSLTWRTPPFAFHDQVKSSAHGGQPETIQVGNVNRVERDGDTIHAWGNLDLGAPSAVEYARRLAEGFAGWVSIGLDESPVDVEFVWPEGNPDVEGDDVGGGIDALFAGPEQEIYRSGRIGELTSVSVPAQAEATVEATPLLLQALADMGVTLTLTASATPVHTTDTSALPWDDGAALDAALPDPMPVATADLAYAWYDDAQVAADMVPKAGCVFPHHDIDPTTSAPGAANTDACTAVIDALAGPDGAAIPDTDRQGVYDHVAGHLTDAGVEPAPFTPPPLVAAGHIIELPDVPPGWWFHEPTDVTPLGALTVTDEGRVYGWVAPAGVAHRAFPGRRVLAPMERVDLSRWMKGETIVAGGGRVVSGSLTMECGHLPPSASSDPGVRMEHYDNACSVVATAATGIRPGVGQWFAGALVPGVTANQVARLMSCALSGDWPPHPERPGWTEFVAALVVPTAGFPMPRTAPSVRVRDGALVASAIPVRFAHTGADSSDPDLRPVLERVARSIGRDAHSRLSVLHARVHGGG